MSNSLAQFHRSYWKAYAERQHMHSSDLPFGYPSNCYFIFSMGVAGSHLAASILVRKKLVTFYLLIQGDNRTSRFERLLASHASIDAELGAKPLWALSTDSNRARVTVELQIDDPFDQGDWPRQHRWILQCLPRFDKAFRDRLRAMKDST